MELEQRVKTLEYEMKIIKNEIQRTLLDIHEQVLIHYYPSLRIDESVPSAAVVQSLEAARAKQTPPAESPMAKLDPADETPAPTPVRRVSLDQIRGERSELPAPKPALNQQAVFVKLLEWVVKNTTKIGSSRLNRLLKVCGEEGILDSETLVVLLQVVALNKGTEPTTVIVNDILDELLKLDKLLGRASDAEEALSMIEGAGLG